MTYRGHVENGAIQLQGSVVLPEGAEVRVELTSGEEGCDPNAPTIEEELQAIWADIPEEEWNRLPSDLTDNLDHYVYETPRGSRMFWPTTIIFGKKVTTC